MIFYAKIKNARSEWTEMFECENEQQIRAIVDSFNRTLKPQELKREFVEIVNKKYKIIISKEFIIKSINKEKALEEVKDNINTLLYHEETNIIEM